MQHNIGGRQGRKPEQRTDLDGVGRRHAIRQSRNRDTSRDRGQDGRRAAYEDVGPSNARNLERARRGVANAACGGKRRKAKRFASALAKSRRGEPAEPISREDLAVAPVILARG